MFECTLCGELNDEDDVLFHCPFCDEEITGEGVWKCSGCGEYIDCDGEEWVCEDCNNEGGEEMPEDEVDECPSCGAVMYGDYCEECGWPDVNQGWLGENY